MGVHSCRSVQVSMSLGVLPVGTGFALVGRLVVLATLLTAVWPPCTYHNPLGAIGVLVFLDGMGDLVVSLSLRCAHLSYKSLCLCPAYRIHFSRGTRMRKADLW